MADFQENVIEWITGQEKVTLSLSQRRHINKVKALAVQYPNEVQIVAQNRDGSICAHIPVSYIRLQRPPAYSDEQKARFASGLRGARTQIDENRGDNVLDE